MAYRIFTTALFIYSTVYITEALGNEHDYFYEPVKIARDELLDEAASYETDRIILLASYTGPTAEECKNILNNRVTDPSDFSILQKIQDAIVGEAERIDNETYKNVTECGEDYTCVIEALEETDRSIILFKAKYTKEIGDFKDLYLTKIKEFMDECTTA